jgi:hypothetical protein
LSDRPIFVDLGPQGAGDLRDAEGLREEAASALERSSHFVEAHGGALDQARIWAYLEAKPVESAVDCLALRQRDDGSFPPLVERPSDAMNTGLGGWGADSPLVGTLQALSMLADLRQLVGPAVDRAVDFLSGVQLSDGSWGRDADPDTADARLFGTAMLTGMLGKTRAVRPGVLGDATDFVAERWAPERVEGGGWSAIAAFANFFTNIHHERGDEALQWCGRELERAFRTRRFEALSVLRVLLTSDAAALPGSTLSPPELLGALLSEQAADGGFAELESRGVPARVEPTIDATLAILRLCTGL